MKKIITLLILVVAQCSYSQEEGTEKIKGTEEAKGTENTKKAFGFEASGRIQALYPVQFGNHSLSEAHQTDGGFGLSVSFFNFKNFRLSPGFDRVFYRVKENNLVGNFKNSNYTSIYGSLSYEIPVSSTVSILPDGGIGFVSISQRDGSREFGHQEGKEFRLGLTADYSIDKHIKLFIAARYIYSKLKINTNPEYEKFLWRSKTNTVLFWNKSPVTQTNIHADI